MEDSRYKIFHKLGCGGYSTVWLARDRLLQRYVALKISVSEPTYHNREIRILHALQTRVSSSSGSQNVVQLLDHFEHMGPNGTHTCLVLEVLGPSVLTVIDSHTPHGRLSGSFARRISKQIAPGLHFLHKIDIGHGDIHTGNIVFTVPALDSLPEAALSEKFRPPQTSPIFRFDGGAHTKSVPKYLVWPDSVPAAEPTEQNNVKIIDFGGSFEPYDEPQTLHTPFALRAPEVLFKNRLDHRVDLWSFGCMVEYPSL